MARLIVLTDRRPEDPDWKGAFVWNIVLSLAESQHEILAITPHPPEEIPFTHSRLQVVQPVRSWSAEHLPRLIQTIMAFQPDGLHTFSLQPSERWPRLTVWPWLADACALWPRLERWTTLFEADDWNERHPARSWMTSGRGFTVFNEAERRRLSESQSQPVQITPLEMNLLNAEAEPCEVHIGLVPASVDEWVRPERDLRLLRQFLLAHPDRKVEIAGGWGEIPSRDRKNGWALLAPVADRIEMIEPLSFNAFNERLLQRGFLWLQALRPNSWRYRISRHVARQMGREILESTWPPDDWQEGSTANFLSRLYAKSN